MGRSPKLKTVSRANDAFRFTKRTILMLDAAVDALQEAQIHKGEEVRL